MAAGEELSALAAAERLPAFTISTNISSSAISSAMIAFLLLQSVADCHLF
jgi:hypothetical protein